MLVRIYTEDKNRTKLIELVMQYFTSFTILPAVGICNKNKELSIILEIEIVKYDDKTKSIIIRLCKEIKKMNSQKCCLVLLITNECYFVS
jgi:hypothetical protein